ncbi:DUF3806 domain-containing protein [Undibacterium sp. Rencai35W]|uniref:DUF3806 domain-containing protein n=1 Tax=Undibacterium sp. Rencai35W TaxID=3413046 RepID=UPI003BEFB4C3
MAIVTSIFDALRKFGRSNQKTAIHRQDEQLVGKQIISRNQHVSRSELGTATGFVATIEPTPETLVPLTDEELTPILENAIFVDSFFSAFLNRASSDKFLDDLDNAFGMWTESADKKGYSDEAVIEIVGAAFGKFCVETLCMRWVRIVDEYGIAIAIQGRVKDFRSFPFDVISKRIPSGEYGFFKPVYINLQEISQGDCAPTNVA